MQSSSGSSEAVNGFRVDTVNLYSKPEELPDAPITDPTAEWQNGDGVFCNGPRMHEYLQEMGTIFARYDAMTVGELPVNSLASKMCCVTISASRNELSQVFQFDISALGRSPDDFYARQTFRSSSSKKWWKGGRGSSRAPMRGPRCFWKTHDLPRAISKYASDRPEDTTASGKCSPSCRSD